MKSPWVSRSHHEEVCALLRGQLADCESERRACLNRLAVLGMGAELFPVAKTAADPEASTETEDIEMVSEDELLYRALSHRPGRLASAITNRLKTRRARGGDNSHGQMVARIPDVGKMLDEVEAAGRAAAHKAG